MKYSNCTILNHFLYTTFPLPVRSIIRQNLGWRDYLKVSLINLRNTHHYRATKLEGEFLWAFDDWSQGYFHWLFDVLPKLLALMNYHETRKVLVPEDIAENSFVRETCADLGLDIVPLQRGRIYKVECVYSHSNFPYYDLAALRDLRNRFFEVYALPKADEGHRNLYISRAKAARRRITNEADLLDALERYGFEIVYLEDFCFREQVAIFSQANIVIGLHGAGLANIVFSPESTTVCEIRSTGFSNDVFSKLTAKMGMYYSDLEVGPSGINMLKQDFTVDVETLEKTLAKIIEISEILDG